MEMKFIVDTMLGKLGRWMLLLGYDVVYYRGRTDQEMLEIAEREDRIIVTRDTHLAEEHPRSHIFLIRTIHFWEQLQCVMGAFPMDFAETLLTRCSHCNVPVEQVSAEEVEGDIPPKARERATVFFRCPRCLKLYWDGTHPVHIRELLKEYTGLDVKADHWGKEEREAK